MLKSRRACTCFQFDYDWRLDLAANAKRLERFEEVRRDTPVFVDSTRSVLAPGAAGLDATRLALLGHSRGGEGVVRAYYRILSGNYTPVHFDADDILLVRGPMENILTLKETFGLLLLTDIKLSDTNLSDEHTILAEVQLSPTSRLIGSTLKEIDFRRRFGCFVERLELGGIDLGFHDAQRPR